MCCIGYSEFRNKNCLQTPIASWLLNLSSLNDMALKDQIALSKNEHFFKFDFHAGLNSHCSFKSDLF